MSSKWNLINADSGQKTWLTPRGIIEALGHFDTDPCCPSNMPWRTADIMLTKEDDGTTAEWRGRVWLNPPYGRESNPFIIRMATHKGGVSRFCSRVPTRRCGRIGYSHTHIRYCLCAVEYDSATHREICDRRAQPQAYLSRTRNPTKMHLSEAG